MFQTLTLGAPRLWRYPAKGAKYNDNDHTKMHKVFCTFSFKARNLIREKKIKVNI